MSDQTLQGARSPLAQPQAGGAPVRCQWPGLEDEAYAHYHDTEWGVPVADDRRLFEKLVLEGFQSGLSWLTILKKRENFRAAFDGFEPERVARFGADDVARLMENRGIVRNRMKIEAAVASARAYLALKAGGQTLSDVMWGAALAEPAHRNRRQRHGDIPAVTPASTALSRQLKALGFKFVGPTTVYALMQSAGMANDHLVGCHRHGSCADLQAGIRAELGAGRIAGGE